MKWMVLMLVATMAIGCASSPTPVETNRVPEIDLGEKAMASGDYRGAISNFTLWLDQYPKDADAFFHRGRAHNMLGEYEAALGDFEQAYRCYPKNLAPEVYRCGVLVKLGKGSEAAAGIASLRKHDLFPNLGVYEQFLVNLLDGTLKNQAKAYKSALEPLDEAVRLADLNADVFRSRKSAFAKCLPLYQRTRSYFYLARHADMVRDMEEYMELSQKSGQPIPAEDYRTLAMCYWLTRQQQKCQQILVNLSEEDRRALGEAVNDMAFFNR